MTAPSNLVTIEIPAKLAWFVRSPLYFLVSSLVGVSISFAPLFLYWSGKGWFYPSYTRVIVPLCFGVIYLVPLFYIVVGQAVANQLRLSSK